MSSTSISVKTILFVENDPVSLAIYQKRLEREGFHLECAPDGQAALDILSEHAPDLVLLDLMLPKVSGADVLKFMQADPRLTTVPVIIFSNAPLTEVPPDSPLAQGTKRLLKSDCTFPKLLETIQETLAAVPEFVVIEAGKKSSTKPAAANAANNGNGESKGVRPQVPPTPNAETGVTKQRAEFLKEALAVMPKIREHSMGYIKAPESAASQTTHLSGLHQRVHLLNTSAAQADCARVALLTNAFDALLSGIVDKPSTVTPSVLQSIAQAVDCLDGLLKNNDGYSVGPPFQAKVLVVDDDTVCNHVNVTSLKRANFDTVGVKDPAAALSLLETTQFDLVVLDVNMPGMTGFDVCEKLRRLPHCKKTPVIFVTGFSNFDNRKQSVLSGGNDFVSKPVSPLELALKVTVNLIKARVQGVPQPQTSSAATDGSAHSLQPAAKAKTDRQVNMEVQPPEPPSRLVPTVELGARNTKAAGPLPEKGPEPEPRPASAPEHTPTKKASTPASQPSNGEPKSSEIYERLRQGTAGLDRAKAGLEHESAERMRLESEWREQVTAAKALIEQTETVLKEKEARCGQLEEELAGLRQARDEFQNKLKTEQQAAAKFQQETKDLQERLHQGTVELERTKTTLEQQSAERKRLESEWREQLTATKTAAGQTEIALKEKESRCGQLEKELAGLRQMRDELQNKLTTEQQAVAKSQQEFKELQERLRQGTVELERTKTTLEQQSAERKRLESEWCEQLNVAKAAFDRTGIALKEKETRCIQLEKELSGQQQLRDELQNKFAAEQQATAKSQQETKELQERLRQSGVELERTRAGLEQESAKRASLESEYQKLAGAKDALNLELRSVRESQAAHEVEQRDKQRKLAESLRENIQLLQLRLQEAETSTVDSGKIASGKSMH